MIDGAQRFGRGVGFDNGRGIADWTNMDNPMQPVLDTRAVDFVAEKIAWDTDEDEDGGAVAVTSLYLEVTGFEVVDEGAVLLERVVDICLALAGEGKQALPYAAVPIWLKS